MAKQTNTLLISSNRIVSLVALLIPFGIIFFNSTSHWMTTLLFHIQVKMVIFRGKFIETVLG
jgi:hypothetical protein